MAKLIILDRDGVINRERGHICAPEDWQPLPGSLEAIARLCRHDYKIAVLTNQSAVGRGLLTVDELNKIHLRMHHLARRMGGDIEAVLFCPHHPDHGCDCRKPRPGMFHELAARLQTSLAGVPAVGDSLRDLQAAAAAGASPVLALSGNAAVSDIKADKTLGAIPAHADLAAFADHLLGGSG